MPEFSPSLGGAEPQFPVQNDSTVRPEQKPEGNEALVPQPAASQEPSLNRSKTDAHTHELAEQWFITNRSQVDEENNLPSLSDYSFQVLNERSLDGFSEMLYRKTVKAWHQSVIREIEADRVHKRLIKCYEDLKHNFQGWLAKINQH